MFSKQPKDKPTLDFDLRHLPKKRRDEIETIRPAFEDWITSSPYEREIKRWPKDETKYAWPGQYCDITTQLAWEAWQESAFVHKLPNASDDRQLPGSSTPESTQTPTG